MGGAGSDRLTAPAAISTAASVGAAAVAKNTAGVARVIPWPIEVASTAAEPGDWAIGLDFTLRGSVATAPTH